MKQIHELLGYKNIKIIQDDDLDEIEKEETQVFSFITEPSNS